MKTIEQTIAFIQCAHEGQRDKAAMPYWLHPVAVMKRLGPDATHNEKLTALLHDVLEDTGYSGQDLLFIGFPRDVVAAVELLTRPKGAARPEYLDWIRTLAASGNRLAIRVKIADNEENADPARLAKLDPAARIKAGRYDKALTILRPALPQ